jgi:hypothetical protein
MYLLAAREEKLKESGGGQSVADGRGWAGARTDIDQTGS